MFQGAKPLFDRVEPTQSAWPLWVMLFITHAALMNLFSLALIYKKLGLSAARWSTGAKAS